MTSTRRTPLVIPPIDFDTPTGDEMVAIDKGFGGGAFTCIPTRAQRRVGREEKR